jgi:hypothetical protein
MHTEKHGERPLDNRWKKQTLARLCTIVTEKRTSRWRARSGPWKGRDAGRKGAQGFWNKQALGNGKSPSLPCRSKELGLTDRSPLLRGRTEEKLPCQAAVALKQGLKERPRADLWLPAKGFKVAGRLLPRHGPR